MPAFLILFLKKVHKSTKYSERDTKQEDNNIHYRYGLIVEKSLRGRLSENYSHIG